MTGTPNDLIKYRIERFFHTLREAKTMMDNEFWNASVNRIYYSCYYVVSAALLSNNIITSSHKGIRQMFGLHFVHKWLVSKDDGRFFADLYDRRQTGDYDDFISYDRAAVLTLYQQAEGFISRVSGLISS